MLFRWGLPGPLRGVSAYGKRLKPAEQAHLEAAVLVFRLEQSIDLGDKVLQVERLA